MLGLPGWLRHPLEPVPEAPKLPPRIWERLTEWRKTWSELWYLCVRDKHYVFRSPTRQDCIEHDLSIRTMPARAVDAFVSGCILYPDQLPADLPATDIEVLYEAIWSSSGFRDPEAFDSKLALFDNVVRSPEQENLLLMMRAFPGLLPDVINSWQPEKIIYHIALARVMLGAPPMKQPDRPSRNVQTPTAPPERTQKPFDWNKDLQEWKAFERSG
jgi:hypothetical protein